MQQGPPRPHQCPPPPCRRPARLHRAFWFVPCRPRLACEDAQTPEQPVAPKRSREEIRMGNRADCDLLLTGGSVITMDATRRVLDPGVVAVTGDRIVGVEDMSEG